MDIELFGLAMSSIHAFLGSMFSRMMSLYSTTSFSSYSDSSGSSWSKRFRAFTVRVMRKGYVLPIAHPYFAQLLRNNFNCPLDLANSQLRSYNCFIKIVVFWYFLLVGVKTPEGFWSMRMAWAVWILTNGFDCEMSDCQSFEPNVTKAPLKPFVSSSTITFLRLPFILWGT